MERKKLKELNLLDNFLFWSMVSYPGIGEEFIRRILETVFAREFGELTIIPEKGYPGSDTDLHGARLDVYVEGLVEEEMSVEAGESQSSGKFTEKGSNKGTDAAADVRDSRESEEESRSSRTGAVVSDVRRHSESETGQAVKRPVTGRAVVYDLEPDNNAGKRGMLPRRVRFYHAKIDVFSLQSGEDYRALKDVCVVMILPYDPFGLDRMVYTVKNRCSEYPEMDYEDGAVTVFLYTKGTQGEASEELRQLLKYFEETTKENAVNENLRRIHRMVETVKRDGEVTMKYLRILEHESDLVEQGRQEERSNTERERIRADEEKVRADEEKARADEEKARADEEKVRADGEKARANQEKIRADEEKARANQEKIRADAAEKELQNLRRELELLRAGSQ